MKILIIYDSIYGNTEKVALAILKGLNRGGETDVKCERVNNLEKEDLSQYKAIVIGTPTHALNMSQKISEFCYSKVKEIAHDTIIVSFDTRFNVEGVTGASEVIKNFFEKQGKRIMEHSLCCYVEGMEGPLAQEELSKSEDFGKTLAQKLKEL